MGEASSPQGAVDSQIDCLPDEILVDSQIDCLPDEILVEILSRMRLKEAGRTSVLSRRWRYLWSSSRSLCFDPMDDRPRIAEMGSEKFIAWVNRVLELHQAPQLDKFVVHFYCLEVDVRADEVDSWVDFAMRKEVKELELALKWKYEFPNTEKCAFGSLRSLKLEFVNVKDEVVHNILASCPYLETLVMHFSRCTKNLQVFDPSANLKHLEIVCCLGIQSVEVSATSLVSFEYEGHQTDRLLFKNVPNLTKVKFAGTYASLFTYGSHLSYSAWVTEIALTVIPKVFQRTNNLLESLRRLELHIYLQVGESLIFLTILSKVAPLLCQLKITLYYILDPQGFQRHKSIMSSLFTVQPDITYALSYPKACAAESTTFYHENLKLLEMAGYIGCPSEEEFLLQLCKMAPSLEKVVIDTFGIQFNKEPVPYHEEIIQETGASTRAEAMEHAKNIKLTSLLGAGGNMIISSTETKVIWQVEDIPGIEKPS